MPYQACTGGPEVVPREMRLNQVQNHTLYNSPPTITGQIKGQLINSTEMLISVQSQQCQCGLAMRRNVASTGLRGGGWEGLPSRRRCVSEPLGIGSNIRGAGLGHRTYT